MARLSTYLINLDDSHDRLAAAKALLDGIGLPFERLSAFDGRGLAAEDLPDYDAKAARKLTGRGLSGGEVGCYQSHLIAARRFLDSGATYGLALEDDLGVRPGALDSLQGLLDWFDAHPLLRWDLANLGAPVRRSFLPVKGCDWDNPLCHAFHFPVTTTAILWSRQGAEAFLTQGRPILQPVDHFLRAWVAGGRQGLAFRQALFPSRGEESLINQGKARQIMRQGAVHWLKRQWQLQATKAAARAAMKRHEQTHGE